jgi:hypothetical protein
MGSSAQLEGVPAYGLVYGWSGAVHVLEGDLDPVPPLVQVDLLVLARCWCCCRCRCAQGPPYPPAPATALLDELCDAYIGWRLEETLGPIGERGEKRRCSSCCCRCCSCLHQKLVPPSRELLVQIIPAITDTAITALRCCCCWAVGCQQVLCWQPCTASVSRQKRRRRCHAAQWCTRTHTQRRARCGEE